MTLEQYVRSLATVTLDRPVGSRYEYCSANYDILGLIVQTVSGEPYSAYIQQHIFALLQMHDSFATEQQARRDGLAQGYRWLFGVPAPFDYYNTVDVPAGYLVSSAGDLTHYLIAQMNGRRFGSATVLSSDGIATMHAPVVPRKGGKGSVFIQLDKSENTKMISLSMHSVHPNGGIIQRDSSSAFNPQP